MKRPYVRLAIVVVVAGLALGLLSKLPRREAARPLRAPDAERVTVALEIGEGGAVTTDRARVPKGSLLVLRAVNMGALPRTLSLSGYEDRLRLLVVPGEIAHATIRADRPGGDLAWLVDGNPAGRFAVTGSHLDENSP
ncbi:MAG TPA: hypothetical protein VFU59_09980 [Candidatus Eisenbacteria bacterium]|nr:hypothetical protein [Candidatus Eisenbacteria bacterium]